MIHKLMTFVFKVEQSSRVRILFSCSGLASLQHLFRINQFYMYIHQQYMPLKSMTFFPPKVLISYCSILFEFSILLCCLFLYPVLYTVDSRLSKLLWAIFVTLAILGCH